MSRRKQDLSQRVVTNLSIEDKTELERLADEAEMPLANYIRKLIKDKIKSQS